MTTAKNKHMFYRFNNSSILCNSNKAQDGQPAVTAKEGEVTCNLCLRKMYTAWLKQEDERKFKAWKESLSGTKH